MVDYTLQKRKGYFETFIINEDSVDINKLKWLPQNLVDIILATDDDMDRFLTFDIKNLSIIYEYTPVDPDTGDEGSYQTIEVKLTELEFTEYLTKLFYHVTDYVIENYESEIDIYLEYKLMNDPIYVRKYLLEWE